MRFHLGSIPDEFTPDSSWRPIREPGPAAMQLFAVPIGVGMAALVMSCWHRLSVPISLHVESSSAVFFRVCLLLSVPALIVVHELLHAVVYPNFGRSPSTIIGAWPSRLLFYAHYSGPLSRNRFVAVFAMPFLVITVLPLTAAATGSLPSGLTMAAAWFSICNALFACGDCFGIGLILAQVPRAAIVQNKSWRTYWSRLNAETLNWDQARESAFSLTNRLRARNAGGFSGRSAARNEVSGVANHGFCNARSAWTAYSGAGS